MAFTGTATVEQISDAIVRVTGLSLSGGASGTIGLAGHTGSAPGVSLPAAFQPEPYKYGSVAVSLQACIDVSAKPADTSSADFQEVAVVKTGTNQGDWRATLTNTFASATPGLEIYIRFHE